ncbi:MAG: hypothetical protein ACKOQZ_05125, partial [Actinomycetota bacterium]
TSVAASWFSRLDKMSVWVATRVFFQGLQRAIGGGTRRHLARVRRIDALVASIITVEARHAAVFGVLPTLNLSSALDNTASSIAPGVTASAETTVAP